MDGNLAENRFNRAYQVTSSGKVVDHIQLFTNPIMKSAILSYTLESAANVRINIHHLRSGKIIRSLFHISGNPGGRKGINKVIWDGKNDFGIKVPMGRYQLHLLVKDQTLFRSKPIPF